MHVVDGVLPPACIASAYVVIWAAVNLCEAVPVEAWQVMQAASTVGLTPALVVPWQSEHWVGVLVPVGCAVVVLLWQSAQVADMLPAVCIPPAYVAIKPLLIKCAEPPEPWH